MQPESDEDLEDLQFRVEWKNSPERHVYVRGYWIAGSVAAAIGVGSFLFFRSYGHSLGIDDGSLGKNLDESTLALTFLCTFTAALFGSGLWFAIAHDSKRRELYERLRVAAARRELEQTESDVSRVSSLQLDAQWSVTQKRLDYYHELATNQAKVSFRHSQRAIIGGFGALIVSMGFAAFSGSTGGAVASGIVGAAGAALAGYLSKTFLRTQETTSTQLRSYFSQPLIFSQHLAAERLLDKLEGDQKSAAIRDVIKAIVGASTSSTGGSGEEDGSDKKGKVN